MENKTVAKTLRLLSQLMELHDLNSFKVKSVAAAAFKVDKLPYRIATKNLAEIEGIDGIGKSTASKIWELLQHQTIAELEELLAATPAGIIEILGIKGLGPKKVNVIWKELGIESIGELVYACNENRLIEAKGFGLKTQEEIKKAIEFKVASNGRFLYAQVEEVAEKIFGDLKKAFVDGEVSYVGDFRRKCEIIDGLDILIGKIKDAESESVISSISGLTIEETKENQLVAEHVTGIKVVFNFCHEKEFSLQLALQTASEPHLKELKERLPSVNGAGYTSELGVYQSAGLQFIEPELREGTNEFDLAGKGEIPRLVEWNDLKGCIHNHSTWSDGVNTLEEMAIFCRDTLKLEYLGISDHSKSAFYAKGLTEDRVLQQHEEIDQLNQKLGGFKIFKGIESDILFDGSLDYPDEILARFDFVVASIHSVFKMSEEKATSRLITAIENPYTTILGHPSGRMLLTRNGYPVDFKKVIDACAANAVVIEINSNPLRLDLDWRWHQYALEKGVMLSINPDAHSNKGFSDMHYGINIARKGGLSARNCLNTLNKEQIADYFKQKKSRI